MLALLLLSALLAPAFASPFSKRWPGDATCRFATTYSASDLASRQDEFIDTVMTWEGKFHAESIGYNPVNGMTYDGTLLDVNTGERNYSGGHNFSAASKEALQVMMYAQVISGNPQAARWIRVNDSNVQAAQAQVIDILTTKLETYLAFNATYPGFGGLLPWFANLPGNKTLAPTYDWVNRIPALDNGELIWGIYAVLAAIEDSGCEEWAELGKGWQAWLDYAKTTAAKLFYHGEGRVCSVIDLNQTLSLDDPAQNITCEGGITALLDDPYEGELFTWFLYFFSPDLDDADREALWEIKRAKLVALEYAGSVVNISASDATATNFTDPNAIVTPLDNGPITVQRGFWFSAHEQWKILEMPYLDVPLIQRVFMNAERVRTCNSAITSNPGLYASVNNVTSPLTNDVNGYISYAGIPSVSNQTLQELDVITPYGSFPTFLFDKTVAIAWYHNMLVGKGMQNSYGSTESTKRDGTAIAAFVSWDSKVTTVNAMLGGTGQIVKGKMMRDGIYDEFCSRIGDEYGRVFGDLKGEDVELCTPSTAIPDGGASDFSACT